MANLPRPQAAALQQPVGQEAARQETSGPGGALAGKRALTTAAKSQGNGRARAFSAPPAPGMTQDSAGLVKTERVPRGVRQPPERIIPDISLVPPPQVRQFDPRLAAEAQELLSRSRSVLVPDPPRRAAPAQSRRRAVAFVDAEWDDESNEDGSDEDPMTGLPVRDDDSDESFTIGPSRAQARRSMSRSRPAGRPRGSGAHRRSSGAEPVFTGPAAATAPGSLGQPKKRGPGRPKKQSLPQAQAQPQAAQQETPGFAQVSQPTDTPSSRRRRKTRGDVEATETPKAPRGYRKRKAPPDDANEIEGHDGRPRKHKRHDSPAFDPNVLLHSTEGRSMTRTEFLQAFDSKERKYLPGGRLGGGQYIIVATGETWTFETLGQKRSNAPQEARTLKAQQPVADTPAGTMSSPTAQKEASEAGQQTPSGPPQPLLRSASTSTPRARGSGASLPRTPSQPTATRIRLTVPNSGSSPAAPTPTPRRIRIAVSTPKTDDGKPKGIRDRVRERVQELDARCRRFHVKTRDKFRTHKAFLEYAEGMRDLLFPEQASPLAGAAARPAAPAPAPAPVEGFAEIRERAERKKREAGAAKDAGRDAEEKAAEDQAKD
ncbi:hypothetical protein VTJ83DRAFT_4239 [Remersonia thermophila]|uniref:Uncharacterized protein n=1 Tax=Remersonia thermophila TaxID=72144 RepID=A0ABR4D9B7_9PEZI